MYQPIALFIGLRYMRGRTRDSFYRFISWFSTIGIMLGVMALIIVLSVMNGFEHNLEKNILGFIPHALVTSITGSINPKKVLSIDFQNLPGVNRITPLTRCNAVLQSSYRVAAGVILGVNPDSKDPLSPYINGATLQDLQPSKYNAILGDQLARKLGIKLGEKIRIIVPAASYFTPTGRIPSHRLFKVLGTFSADSEVDQYQILINQQDASRLMRYPLGNITGWRVYMDSPLTIDNLVSQHLKKGLKWEDWRDLKGELFQAVKMEKNILGLLLSLIVDIAAFNIITALSILVMEKKNEVAILQTQGLTHPQIMSIFMLQGASRGIIGAFLGTLFGVLFASQINFIPGLSKMLSGGSLPVQISISQVVLITLLAALMSLLSTLYPAYRAAVIDPVEALRYE
ncbi:lipoprotein-releasing ABC transporter permease subunit LolC [Candidatus Profftia tarda]|nr:lipoprotein-releasing ABC transporter permease subunit LolC [Candidatus Profftia tarda]